MQNILDELCDQYNCFTPNKETKQEIEAAHQTLIRSMDGGTFVDGDGDINKMVGIMGGQSAEGCSESEQP